MRVAMFITFVVACLLAVLNGLLSSGALAPVLGAIWSLVAVVAMGFRAVLDALHRREHSGMPAEGVDRGGVRMPGWLK